MTTFIDFRYSRALATALFAGQEKEETEIVMHPDGDTYFVLDFREHGPGSDIAAIVGDRGSAAVRISRETGSVALRDGKGGIFAAVSLGHGEPCIVGVRVGRDTIGLRAGRETVEARIAGLAGKCLDVSGGAKVMGRGTGRVSRWGELFFHRGEPIGLCVELTMDWHHLRAGIPLFSTMTAEELVAAGQFRLRFRSYAYEASDAEATDFVRLFGCDDAPDVAVHLTPALYDPRAAGIPNLGFGVIETERVHPHLVDRCNRMDRICVPSSFTRDAFQTSGVTRPIDVVLHGVDSEYFRPLEGQRTLPGGKGFNFLAIGTHVERKNVEHIVRAFLEEFRENEDVALFLLLRPEYHTTQNNVALEFTEWERRWAGDSAPIFLWTGYLTREHLRDFYAGADAYVMPSNEGFGLTLLEAMSCGTPAIALDHGGVTDFVNDANGILVPAGKAYLATDVDTLPYVGDRFHEPDIGALRAAMRRMADHPAETRRLGSRARADAENLTWKSVTAGIAASIEKTYGQFHADRKSAFDAMPAAPDLTLVLCVLDDAAAARTLDYLSTLATPNVHVLCLFTRYARVDDVMRARQNGFVYYRWDGTLANAKVIARSIVGRSWIFIVSPGERLIGRLDALTSFLRSQPAGIDEVVVPATDGSTQSRAFHVRPQGEPSGKSVYTGLSVRLAAE
ncbi:MAG: glycosyltransferase family 4 protein [Gemmatimonadaceae bacterium]